MEDLQASYMWMYCRSIENVESFCPLCSTTTTTKLNFITAEYKKITSSRELARTAFCTFKHPHARARSIDIVVCDLLLWTLLSWPSGNSMEVLSRVPTRARKKKCFFSRVVVAAKRQGDLYSSIRVVAWELCVCLCRNWRMAAVVVCHSSSSSSSLGRFASVTRSVDTSRPRWTFCVTTTVKLRFNRSLTGTKHVLQLLLSSIQFAKDLLHEGRQALTHTYTCSACFFATLHTVRLFSFWLSCRSCCKHGADDDNRQPRQQWCEARSGCPSDQLQCA
jgi:hypothetical protein